MLQKRKVTSNSFSLLFCLLQFVVFAQEVEPQITATRIFMAKGLSGAFPRPESIGLETLAASEIEGNVRVAIYNNEIYDPSNPNASFLYGFEGDPTVEAVRQNNSYVLEDPKRRKWWSASDFKALLDTDPIQYYTTQFASNAPAIFRRSLMAFFKNYIASWSGGTNSGGDNNFSKQSKKFSMEYRAEVTYIPGQEETVNVNVAGIGGGTIPGEALDLNYPDLHVFVYRNGALVEGANAFRLNPQPGQQPNPTLNLVLGDSVVFRTKHLHFNFPDLPEVWIARSAGESLYYCTKEHNLLQYVPSISRNGKLLNSLSTRNKYAPFIGFDFQDGAFITRGYADPNHISQPIAIMTPEIEQEWYWIAQRRMDKDVTDFSDDTNVTFDIAKDKNKFNNNTDFFDNHFNFNSVIDSHLTDLVYPISKIRNNKREGFNRQQLFTLWPMDEGYDDEYNINFTLGFDGNEFFSRESTGYSAMAVKNNTWKRSYPLIPEGFHQNLPVFNAILENRNKKKGWSTIDLFVSQYLTHQLLRDPDSRYSELVRAGELAFDYRGYEIQDKNTYIILNNTPIDACNGKPCVYYVASGVQQFSNVKAPGKITFKFKDPQNITKQFPLYVNISSPLLNDKGFYGGLVGDQWPSVGQKNVPYAFKGLKGMKAAERQQLVMEYTHENHLGILKRVTRPFNQANYNVNGHWIERFDIESTIGYNEITVYYKTSNNPGASRVIIAGKELLEIELRHVSVPGSRAFFVNPSGGLEGIDLKEGKGEASKTYLTDLVEQSENYGPEFGDLPHGVFKRYVFSKGDEATFVAMDGAPHTFFHYDEEWELSERTMAKRLYPGDLSNRIQWYLALEGSDLPTHLQSGQKLNYTFLTPGKYRLTARYNECSALTVEVLVKSEPYIDKNEAAKGEITLYPLTPRQREILIMAHPDINISNSLKVAKLENAFSAFEAKNTWFGLRYNEDFHKIKEFAWLLDEESKPLDLEIIQDITLPGKYVFTGFLEDDLTSENTEFEIPYAAMQGILSDDFVEPYQARFPSEKRYRNIWIYEGYSYITAQDLARKYRLKSKGMVALDKYNFLNRLGDFSGVFFGVNQGLQKYGTEENYQEAVTESAFPPNYDPLKALFLNDFSTGRKVLLDPMATRGKALEVTELIRVPNKIIGFSVAELKAEAPSDARIHLEFENNLDDTSGNNVQSTSPSPVYLTYQPAQKKQAVSIIQNPSKIQVDVNASYIKTQFTERTLAFWFRTSNHSDNINANKFILDYGNITDGIALKINGAQNEVVAGFRNQGVLEELSVSFEFMTWHHVALVFKKGQYQLYLDGSAIGTVSHLGFHESQTISENMLIGGNSSTTAFGNATVGSFRGMVDDFYLYDKALSLTEINQLIMSAVPDDISGSQHKSNAKISLEKGVEPVVLYPNPTAKNKALTLEIHLEKAETITYSITDVSGRMLVSKSISLSAGTTKTPVKVSGLKAGVYIVEIKGNQLHSTHKIVVD